MKILAIDDDPKILDFITQALDGASVTCLTDPKRAVLQLAEGASYDLILCDINFPDASGFELHDALEDMNSRTPFVMITGSSDSSLAIRAFREGVTDFLFKPFTADELAKAVEKYAPLPATENTGDFYGLIGSSPAMIRLKDEILKFSKADNINILIQGETGTGKELASRAVHACSNAKDEPFLAINCSAIPENLFESELFGHVKGSFTGAHTDRKGIFQEAGKGFVMLDEINSLPLNVQAKINRAIEYREIRKVGSSKTEKIQCNVIAVSNTDLKELTEKQLFRSDLYYRLNTLTINIPPLRERNEDIPALCTSFIAKSGRDLVISPDAMQALLSHDWPGNVRELKHTIDRALLYCEDGTIKKNDLPQTVSDSASKSLFLSYISELSYNEVIAASKDYCVQLYVDALLNKHQGNVSKAAESAQVTRPAFHKIMKNAGISASSYRKPSKEKDSDA